MQLASLHTQIDSDMYYIEYYSGEPFRWKWGKAGALMAAAAYDATPVLNINNRRFIGFDGNAIVEFHSYDLLSGHFTGGKSQNNQYTYKINPKTEYVELISVSLPIGYTPPVSGNLVSNGSSNPLVFKVDYKWDGPPGFSLIPKECEHTWKEYSGFTETYKFCEKCDTKDRT